MTKNVPTEQPSQQVERWSPTGYAILSVLVPGLGQLVQQRPVTAALQFATVAVYLYSAYALGGRQALWLALAWNVWSAIDAWWHSPR